MKEEIQIYETESSPEPAFGSSGLREAERFQTGG
jgi:hypothetical protein